MLENPCPSVTGHGCFSEMSIGLYLIVHLKSRLCDSENTTIENKIWYFCPLQLYNEAAVLHVLFEALFLQMHAQGSALIISINKTANILKSLGTWELQNWALIIQNSPLLCCEHFIHTNTQKIQMQAAGGGISILWTGRNFSSRKNEVKLTKRLVSWFSIHKFCFYSLPVQEPSEATKPWGQQRRLSLAVAVWGGELYPVIQWRHHLGSQRGPVIDNMMPRNTSAPCKLFKTRFKPHF